MLPLEPRDPERVKEIFTLLDEGLTYKQIADKFGVSKSYIWRFIQRYQNSEWDIRKNRVERSQGRAPVIVPKRDKAV